MTPLNAREWLESHVRSANGTADFARVALEALDVCGYGNADLAAIMNREPRDTADDDVKGVIALCELAEAFDTVMDEDVLAKEIGGVDGTLISRFEAVLKYAKDCEQAMFAVRDLAMDAGLIDRGDYETDPLPLIRMFLPVSEQLP